MDINELLFMGNNKYGQAGIGQKHHNKTFTLPKSFAFRVFIKQLSCGAHHSALLTIDGNVYTMGSNIHGTLGTDPSINYSFVPTLVEGLAEVTRIDCGPFHTCAIQQGSLYSWGKGIDGQLGHGNTKNVPRPSRVEALQGEVETVSCGTNHTIVSVNKDGQKMCFAFGNGIYGQLGTGQSRNSYSPARVKLDGIQNFAAGQNHSLFVVTGRVFACGDNSNGQLGTLFNKKFTSQPTKIEFAEGTDLFVMVQAKKYSIALTEKGDMYLWGLKGGFGAPKKVLSLSHSNSTVMDAVIGGDKCYGLTSEGSLYQWELTQGSQSGRNWLCKSEMVLSNKRHILGISAGDGYILILGDIVQQIQEHQNSPHNLSCIQDFDSFPESLRMQPLSESNCMTESHLMQGQNSRQSNFDKIKPQSHTPNRVPKSHNCSTDRSPKLSKEIVVENFDNCLRERKDFANLKHLRPEGDLHQNPKKFIQNQGEPVPSIEPIEGAYLSNDTFQFIKSQSSVIQCQPSNFLKESQKRENRGHSYCKGVINDSFLDSEPQMIRPQVNVHKKRRVQFAEDKQNLVVINVGMKEKGKKIDRLMQMLQKSHSISDKAVTESMMGSQQCQSRLKQGEIIKANRLLRVQVREKELKVSQLQELLSRKEMEIEAQREVIKMLRQKNNSNYASLERNDN